MCGVLVKVCRLQVFLISYLMGENKVKPEIMLTDAVQSRKKMMWKYVNQVHKHRFTSSNSWTNTLSVIQIIDLSMKGVRIDREMKEEAFILG